MLISWTLGVYVLYFELLKLYRCCTSRIVLVSTASFLVPTGCYPIGNTMKQRFLASFLKQSMWRSNVDFVANY